MALPEFLKPYFWEVRFEELDSRRRARYIIERVLEYGDVPAIQWLFQTYPQANIREALTHSRALSQKSANFWALFFEVPREKILCLSKQFRENSRAIWSR